MIEEYFLHRLCKYCKQNVQEMEFNISKDGKTGKFKQMCWTCYLKKYLPKYISI